MAVSLKKFRTEVEHFSNIANDRRNLPSAELKNLLIQFLGSVKGLRWFELVISFKSILRDIIAVITALIRLA
jgi:hypothetical protein